MEEDKTSAGEKNMASMEKPLKTLQKIHLTRFRARTCRLREHRVKCLAMHKDYNETQTEPKGSPSQERESSSPSGSSTKQQADTSLEYTDSVYSPGTYILYLPGSDDEDPEEPPLTRTESLMLAHEHIENISNMLDASEAYKSCRCDACVQSGDLMHESSSEQPEGPQGQVDVVEENTWEGTRRPRTSPDEGKRSAESGSSDNTRPRMFHLRKYKEKEGVPEFKDLPDQREDGSLTGTGFMALQKEQHQSSYWNK